MLPFPITSSYMHRLVAPLRRRLESPLDMALAEICYYDQYHAYEQEGTKSVLLPSSRSTRLSPYSVLAVAADRQVPSTHLFSARKLKSVLSGELSVQQNAFANIQVALSVSRYTRQEMLNALSSSAFSRKAEYASLVQQTATMCIPKACPGREQVGCERHLFHPRTIYRHCGASGELIHLKVRVPLMLSAVRDLTCIIGTLFDWL